MFPEGASLTHVKFRLAGCDVASVETYPSVLASIMEGYEKMVQQLLALPLIPRQSRLLILFLSLKPTGRFGHHLRYLPSSISHHL
eukprot:2164146-Prymnesium_polylepis.1